MKRADAGNKAMLHIAGSVLFTVLLTMLLTAGCSTTAPPQPSSELSEENVTRTEEFEAGNRSKEELFMDATGWFGELVLTDKTVIEFTGRKKGIIVGEVVFAGLSQDDYKFNIRFTVRITVEKGSTEISLTDPMYAPVGVHGGSFSERSYKPLRSNKWFEKYCLPKYRELIASYEGTVSPGGS
jgi:hypothetical protein